MDSFYLSGVCARVSLSWVVNRYWGIDTDILPKQRNAIFPGHHSHQHNHSLVFQILSSLWLSKWHSSATQYFLKRVPWGNLTFSVWFWGRETSVSSIDTSKSEVKGSWSLSKHLRSLDCSEHWICSTTGDINSHITRCVFWRGVCAYICIHMKQRYANYTYVEWKDNFSQQKSFSGLVPCIRPRKEVIKWIGIKSLLPLEAHMTLFTNITPINTIKEIIKQFIQKKTRSFFF